MCKVMMFTNFRNVENNKQKVEWIGNKLLETERDGFGFSIMGKNGVYGEKFVGKNLTYETNVFNKKLSISSYPFISKTKESFGEFSKANGGALFHGRISTNKVGLKNTHPINKHGWSLIHNGVVSDHGPKYNMITDNDTEHLVEHLATGGIEALTKNLTGYYAAGAFDPKGNLHIVRDDIAWLYVTQIPELETFLFATTETLIDDFCIQFEYERSAIELVKGDTYMVFDPKGTLKEFKPIESRGYYEYEASWMDTSLSYMNKDYGWRKPNKGTIYKPDERDGDDDGPTDDDMHLANENKSSEVTRSDYDAYRYEIACGMDETYDIFDWNNRKIPYSEFKLLENTSQDECTILRPDGTLLTYEDYHTDRFPDSHGYSPKIISKMNKQ